MMGNGYRCRAATYRSSSCHRYHSSDPSDCHDRGDGLCHVFVPHATAGVALIETGSGSESDLRDAVDRLLPREDIYRHRHGSRGHGRDHVLPAFVSPSLTLPVLSGQPTLGTWQRVVLVDLAATLTGAYGLLPSGVTCRSTAAPVHLSSVTR